jgi:2-C-methyl-D-erythritol 4-phosphate cytidylyltransferase/2-C-methyl-D-erythritol 2,4-cyclodiphosphate synthase
MSSRSRVAVIVLAAGNGVRLGHHDPKAFVDLGGQPILARALHSVFAMHEQPQVIVTAPNSYVPMARQVAMSVHGYDRVDLSVIAGGETRQSSVAAALAVVGEGCEAVLVHDAARPLTPTVIFDSIAQEVLETGVAVIPGLPVADTIKRIDDDGIVIETINRNELAAVQTPQGFPRAQLELAHRSASDHFTDDAALVAAAGYPVAVIAGDQLAFKITTAWELRQAESVLSRASDNSIRVGSGIDVHAFDPDRPLWLAGLLWPNEPGLVGHSDGDVVAHAICDALLSAARLGDMGSVFGTSSPEYAQASGELFLRRTMQLVRAEGLEVGNAVVQLVGNHPRIGDRRREAELQLSNVLGAAVSLSATTSDALGFTGRGEGLAALATVLVRNRVSDDGVHDS